jgi:hypothetical protein
MSLIISTGEAWTSSRALPAGRSKQSRILSTTPPQLSPSASCNRTSSAKSSSFKTTSAISMPNSTTASTAVDSAVSRTPVRIPKPGCASRTAEGECSVSVGTWTAACEKCKNCSEDVWTMLDYCPTLWMRSTIATRDTTSPSLN